MTEKRGTKQKRLLKSRRRAMDEEHGRQAQLWWMFGVGLLLLVSAYYQNVRPVESPLERGPAQLSPASSGSLPYSQYQSK